MKKCSKCKEEKGLIQFYKDKTRKDGHGYRCKPCKSQYKRENREKYNARLRANYSPEKEKIKREKYRKNEVYRQTFPNGTYYIGQSTWGASRRLGWHFKDALHRIKNGNPHIDKMIRSGIKRSDILVEIIRVFPKGQEKEMKQLERSIIKQSISDQNFLNMRIHSEH